ncbi:YbaN family protein [Colwellia sp. MEBiC06753]
MLYKIIGLFFVGLAIVGAALPVLPTTPFLLVAAGCFAKSSPYLHGKLLANPVFGPLIKDWQQHRSIAKKSKYLALMTMVIAAAWSCYILESNTWRLGLILLMVVPFIFILRLPISDHHQRKIENNQ